MKRITLTAIACFYGLFQAFAQSASPSDSSTYTDRKLRIDEVNLVSSYYHQDGNNSAVTGGIGTEKLTDIANSIDLKLSYRGRKNRIQSIGLDFGVDHYTSASSDKIDPNTITSPSYSDTRIYPSLSWTSTNEKKGNSIGIAASYSHEFDYISYGIGINYAKTSKDKSREFGVKLQSYFDTWTIIYPVELRPNGRFSGRDDQGGETTPRDSYSASFSLSQIINKRFQVAFLLDLIEQQGLLATDYQRVYFTDASERIENLPGKRLKIPIGIRANYFLGDRIILRGYYRFYTDDWGITAHTASLEMPIKINPFFSVSPFYRFYVQTASQYFAPYGAHNIADAYYTSDYDLSKFTSHFIGLNLRFTPEKGVLSIKQFSAVELRYGHYIRSNGLNSNILTLAATFK
ncbi:MAG: DUF3570 domain-containing protein [Chitinophagaceae bacterium]